MDDGRIEDLARSIRSNGVIQPIVVRKAENGYEIVAGERRWRASQRAGLLKVPVVVRDIPDDRLLAAALIENIQREDLNPIEEAHAYRRLGDEFGLTQEQIAESVGKDRSSVANYVRLFRLPPEVRDHVGGRDALDGPCARAPEPARRRESAAGGTRDRAEGALGSRHRSAGQTRGQPCRRRSPKCRKTCTRARPRTACASLSAPACESSGRERAGRIEIDFSDENELQRIYEQLTEKS